MSCPTCGKPMIEKNTLRYCSDINCPNSKLVNPKKCEVCGNEFESIDLRDLELGGINIYSKDKTEALILLKPRKIATVCEVCYNKVDAFVDSLRVNKASSSQEPKTEGT